MSEAPVRMRAYASGRVQGVGFRYHVREVAARFRVTGFVRNLHDGSVEIEAQGLPDEVARFLAEAGKGPPGSRVTGFQVEPAAAIAGEKTFRITY